MKIRLFKLIFTSHEIILINCQVWVPGLPSEGLISEKNSEISIFKS